MALASLAAALNPVRAAPAAAASSTSSASSSESATTSTAAPSISPELADVRVDSEEYRVAKDRADKTASELEATKATRADAEQRIEDGKREREALTKELIAQRSKKRAAEETIGRINAMLRELAVAGYVHDPTVGGASMLAEPNASTEGAGNQVVYRRVTDDQIAELNAAQADFDAATKAIDAAITAKRKVRAEVVRATATREDAIQDEARLTKQLAEHEAALEVARALAKVVGADFPLVALDAYWKAAHAHVVAGTGCGVPWWGVAGVGRIETGHGTYGGSRLLVNGDTSKPIIGISLDGTRNTRFIADTDRGKYDGDSRVDRAVGPMQFIPSTWARWSRDGNGDGVVNPHNLYDAARAAAAFLCQGGPLTRDEALRQAYLRYNRSEAYAEEALGYARSYRPLEVPAP